MNESLVPFDSAVPYDASRVHAAAVYCSDGRFGEQCDDFLMTSLGLPRYDRLAVPGGAACLAGHFDTWREGEATESNLKFLIDAHELERVVLIAHEGCAFYTHRLQLSTLGLEERQFEDLRKVAAIVEKMRKGLVVETWFARIEGEAVRFEPVE